MGDEWKRAEVLLEEIRKSVKATAEGHSVLFRKVETEVDSLRKEFRQEFDDIKKIVKGHSGDIKDIKKDVKETKETVNEIKHDLKEHIHQTAPSAHVAV